MGGENAETLSLPPISSTSKPPLTDMIAKDKPKRAYAPETITDIQQRNKSAKGIDKKPAFPRSLQPSTLLEANANNLNLNPVK